MNSINSPQPEMNPGDLISRFLDHERFALIGASRDPNEFSRILLKEFLRRGYDAVPVNPHTAEIEGCRCFPSIGEVTPPVKAALLLTPRQTAREVIIACAQANVRLLWFYGVFGIKDLSPGITDDCSRLGIELIPGYCPFMFFENPGWFHRLHGNLLKFLGHYPS